MLQYSNSEDGQRKVLEIPVQGTAFLASSATLFDAAFAATCLGRKHELVDWTMIPPRIPHSFSRKVTKNKNGCGRVVTGRYAKKVDALECRSCLCILTARLVS
jgi:nitrate reductase cytochrome c-type subunit